MTAVDRRVNEHATDILQRLERDDDSAAAELLPLVYDELRRLARAYLGREYAAQTIDATER